MTKISLKIVALLNSKLFTHASKLYYDFIVNNEELQGGKTICTSYIKISIPTNLTLI